MTALRLPRLPAFARGTVWLVGAGPGDPGLLSLLALHALRQADDVVYDALVDRRILALARRGATLHYAGKRGGKPSPQQPDISRRLVELARRRRRVLRLKGGDPFVFGRGGEEALALVRAGIDFEIVPGITAGQACAAYAGIPLTHRGLASGVRFITGHRRDDDALVIDSRTLADRDQTLVIYMGLSNLGLIVAKLLAAGRSGSTPAAIIERGTTPRQRNFITTIGQLEATAVDGGIESPALLVIGDVVALADELGAARTDSDEAVLQYA
jgi:uroporphyrin-III C-methyltransferase